MNLDSIPLFAMLKGKLGYVGQREKLIAQNVANADTPGYTPSDLKPFSIAAGRRGPSAPMPMIAPARTDAAHMQGVERPVKGGGAGGFRSVEAPDTETTLDGNRVVLEEQMMKMTEARMEYDAAIGFYQKSLNLLRLATRAPGKGV
jgi:flagellar basal-body rod protein FlgB